MPVGKGSVARAARAAAPAEKKTPVKKHVIAAPEPEVLKALAADQEQPSVKSAEDKKPVEKKPTDKKPAEKSAVRKTAKREEKVSQTAGHMKKGELDGIMVIKSDLPVELL